MKYSLKELRARHNLTMQNMADRLGISYQTYFAWERNFGKVKLEKALQVADILGVTIDEIKH